MSNLELTNIIREIKEYQTMADEINATREGLKDIVKAHMTAQGTEELIVEVYKVRYQSITSNRVDTTALKQAMPEVVSKFTKQVTSNHFSIV